MEAPQPEPEQEQEPEAIEAPLPEESPTVKAVREAFSHNPKGLEVRRGSDRAFLVNIDGTVATIRRFAHTGGLLRNHHRLPLEEISLPENVAA